MIDSIFRFRDFTANTELSKGEILAFVTRNGTRKVVIIPRYLSFFYHTNLLKINHFLFLKFLGLSEKEDFGLLSKNGLKEDLLEKFKTKKKVFQNDQYICFSDTRNRIKSLNQLGCSLSKKQVYTFIQKHPTYQNLLTQKIDERDNQLLALQKIEKIFSKQVDRLKSPSRPIEKSIHSLS